MQREILFRGKRVDNCQWIYGDLLTSNGTECEISDWNEVDYSRHDVDQETVGQFTGMTDKNGTKIFEGDIVNHTRRTSKGIESANAEVYFDTEMLEFGLKYLNELFHCQFNNEFEVIGNIHENK